MAYLKDMMGEEEFHTWACEFELRAEDIKEAEMEARVNADANK